MAEPGLGDAHTVDPPVAPSAARLGVLFVHGIGEQKRGDMLLQCAEPILRHMRDVASSPIPPNTLIAQPGIFDAKVLRGNDPAPDDPAHLTLGWGPDSPFRSLGLADILMAECWWADDIRPASYVQVVRWGIGVAPSALRETVAYQWTPGSRPRNVANGQLPLTLLFGPLLHLLLLLLLLIGLVPIARGLTGSLMLRLAGTFGDPFLLLTSPVRFASMVQRVHTELEWLRRQGCPRVVVIAHSQGAAITQRALKTRPVTEGFEIVRLITFGSAIKRLFQRNERVRHSRPAWQALLPNGAAIGILAAIVWGLWVQDGPLPGIAWPLQLVGALLVLIALYWAGSGRIGVASASPDPASGDRAPKSFADWVSLDPQDDSSAFDGGRPGLWQDYYARADPVPLGPLPDAVLPNVRDREPLDPDRPFSREIRNQDSIPADHTSYWRNVEQFTGPVAAALWRDAGWGAETDLESRRMATLPDALATARSDRVALLDVAFVLSTMAFGVLAGILWPLGGLDRIGAEIARLAAATADGLSLPFEAWFRERIGPGPAARVLMGLAVVLVGTVAWHTLAVKGGWQEWNIRQNDHSLRDPSPQPRFGARSLWFSVPAAIPALVVAAGIVMGLVGLVSWVSG